MTARRWPLLFFVGNVLLLGACITSRYAKPEWTGLVVALLLVAGALAVFFAGRSASKRGFDV